MLAADTVGTVIHDRERLSERLLTYVLTDTILYLPELSVIQPAYRVLLSEVLSDANSLLGTAYRATKGLSVYETNPAQADKLSAYLNRIDSREFAVLYLASACLRSVLLGVLFSAKRIGADEAFAMAFFEELSQQQRWGKDEEIIARHTQIKQELAELERMRDEGSLSEN